MQLWFISGGATWRRIVTTRRRGAQQRPTPQTVLGNDVSEHGRAEQADQIVELDGHRALGGAQHEGDRRAYALRQTDGLEGEVAVYGDELDVDGRVTQVVVGAAVSGAMTAVVVVGRGCR